MVTTFAPSAWAASIVHDLTELPSTWTTQAPHWLVSQPTCVPVRPRLDRRKSTSSVRGSTLPLACLPLTVMLTETITPTSRVSSDPRRWAGPLPWRHDLRTPLFLGP